MLLEQILASENLQQAWKRVKQNKGAAGVDGKRGQGKRGQYPFKRQATQPIVYIN